MSTEDEREAALYRLEGEIESGHPDCDQFLLEHIAQYGTAHFDARSLAERVLAIGDPEDASEREDRQPFWSDSTY